MRRKSSKHAPVSRVQAKRRILGVALWAVGIAAGIAGSEYGLPIALALFVVGFFVFVSAPRGKSEQ